MKNERYIQRIDKKYVGEDCIQKMIAYRNFLAVFGNGENIYRDFSNDERIHSYLEDERRKQFPYSNIPIHTKKILFKKYTVANQLLNFDTPYFIFSSEFSSISYAVKDGESALWINDFFPKIIRTEEYVTRKELDDFFGDYKEGIQMFYYDGWVSTLHIPSQEEILVDIKKHLIEKCIEAQNMNGTYKNTLTQIVVDASSKSIAGNFQFMKDDILMVRSKDKDLSVSFVSLRYEGKDCFKIIKKVLPINYYTLEQIKEMQAKIVTPIEPKIKLSLNSNLTKEDIMEGAKLERILK